MTTIDIEEINHRLATDPEVMGWKDMLVAGYFLDDSFVMYKNSWNPTSDTHLHQAMMCVEKMLDDWHFTLEDRFDYAWECILYDGFGSEFRGSDRSPSLAICKTILEALDG